MADFALVSGFALITAGVWVTWGAGPACLVAGTILFLAGGFAARER